VIALRFGALASHLTDTHIVFVQGRRTQGSAVLSGEVTPTHRYPELACRDEALDAGSKVALSRRLTNRATAVGQSAAPRSTIAS
jgi:hypothetical protein